MAKRKLWLTRYVGGAQRRHESQAAVYRFINAERANYVCRSEKNQADLRYIEVLVDERDGHGFCAFETIDLAERVPWEA